MWRPRDVVVVRVSEKGDREASQDSPATRPTRDRHDEGAPMLAFSLLTAAKRSASLLIGITVA
jgi:hypothetical protein